MPTLTRGVYPLGDAGGAVQNWFPPAFDSASYFDGDYTNPFLFGEGQVIGLFDCRPDERPEQDEVHTAIAWARSPGGVTLRVNSPMNAALITDPLGAASPATWQGGWPPNGSLRLWVGGVDYFHALDQPSQYGGLPFNPLATQDRYPTNIVNQVVPSARGVFAQLFDYIQSGSPNFDPFAPGANPRQQRIFETLIANANQYDLSALLGGQTGAPIEIDIAALAGGCRYVWIALDFVALPTQELYNADDDEWIRPPFLWETFGNNGPLWWVPWTTRSGRCDMDIMPPEVRITLIEESAPPPLPPGPDFSVADLSYMLNPTQFGVRFSARNCRARSRFHVATNCFYNRQQAYAFGSLFAVVNNGAASSFVQDLQHPGCYYPLSWGLNRTSAFAFQTSVGPQPVAPIWGYLHDTDPGNLLTAGHVGQTAGVTVSLLGIRNGISTPAEPWPWGTAPGAIIILGD